MVKRKIVIRGERVQDVGYRLFLLEAAESIGLKGFQARNVEDYVEFLVEGDDDKVADFVGFSRINYPELAKVMEVMVEDYRGSVMPMEGFYRSFSAGQLVKIVNVGVDMLQKQDGMLQKQGSMLQKQDSMLQKQDEMLRKQDILINEVKEMKGDIKDLKKGQDTLINEVRNLREDLKAYMDERFRRLEQEIARIKEKIRIA